MRRDALLLACPSVQPLHSARRTESHLVATRPSADLEPGEVPWLGSFLN
jgi:hypothetical protein